jgi:hypothetical protein
MIQLTINPKEIDKLFSEIDLKISGLKTLISPSSASEIAKAAFTLTGERFVLAVDRFSISNPKRMHHVYEWKRTGRSNARLFVLERESILNGSLGINVSFMPSRTPVPIPAELLSPGPTGKSVTSKTIFRDKAKVMEEGKPIQFAAKKIITFLGTNGQVFLQPGTMVTILNPGGIQVRNSFQQFMLEWYQANSESIMKSSGLYERIAYDVANVLNTTGAGMKEVNLAVKNAASLYSQERVVIK